MGKGHRACEICGLKERHTIEKLAFFKFPLDPYLCIQWVKMVGKEDLVYLPVEKLHDNRRICANHFQKTDFTKKGSQLKRFAIPTNNLMAIPLTESQLSGFVPVKIDEKEQKQLDSIKRADSLNLPFFYI